jgi:aspartyl-tRNA(Asn)/glutamyl-tRNA(Gln) amidotransferase subunit B
MGEVSQFLNSEKKDLSEIKLTPANLSEMLRLIDEGVISSKMGKKVFVELAKNGGSARNVVEKKGLVQISKPEDLVPIINQVLAANPQSVADFQAGKDRALKALMGQIMKETRGQANPQVVNELLLKSIAKK